MVRTNLLNLPLLVAAQNQKHLTVNEALYDLDFLSQISVIYIGLMTLPSEPSIGDAYIVGSNATRNLAAYRNYIALYDANGWRYFAPKEGWLIWHKNAQQLFVFSRNQWMKLFDRKSIFEPDFMVIEKSGHKADAIKAPVAGWNVRSLNQVKINKLGTQASLDSNSGLFKLPKGRYWVKYEAAALMVGRHNADLKNRNNGQHLIKGSAELSGQKNMQQSAQTRSKGEGELIVTSANHRFEINHYVQVGGSQKYRFGVKNEHSATHVEVKIWRLN